MNKQSSHKIRLYGPIRSFKSAPTRGSEIVPSQAGLDFVRRSQATYRLKVNQIKFPKELAGGVDTSKITLYAKVYQFMDVANSSMFEMTSQ